MRNVTNGIFGKVGLFESLLRVVQPAHESRRSWHLAGDSSQFADIRLAAVITQNFNYNNNNNIN